MYKVFIVDDEPFILAGLKSIINWQEYGLEICGQATNGLDALNSIQNQHIDILITDITMPKMNGLQLIKSVKESNPTIKFIVLSGYNDFEYVKEGIKLGIENYLLKPINVHELVSTLVNTISKIEKTSTRYAYTKEDLEILRDNILFRWVTNSIDSLELKERSPILQISLEYSYYMVCSVKILFGSKQHDELNNTQKLKMLSQSYDLCREILSQSDSAICFCEMDGDIIIIFGEESIDESKSKIHKILNEVHNCIMNDLGLDTIISAGDFQQTFKNVHASYTNAKELQDKYSLILTQDKILYYNDEKETPSPRHECPKIDYEAFSKHILSKSKKNVFAFIDDIFDQLQKSSCVAPCDIINLSIELIFHINRTVKNFDNENDTINDYKNLFSNLFKLQTIDEVRKCIKDIADNAINCFITEDDKVNPIIKKVLNYINSHYKENLSLKALSQNFNINSTYLGQLFQKETSELFSDYVNKFKIEKAKQMLLNTDMSTIEISSRAGFSDPNYFYRQFKKYVGVSPSELRNFKKI